MAKVKKALYIILISYLIYLVLFGIVPFARYHPKTVTQNTSPQWIETSNRVSLIDDINESWQVRVDIIEAAETSIDVAYYAFDKGDSVPTFLAHLYNAAENGVKVRLLVDGLTHGLSDESSVLEAFMTHENIEVAFYHRPNLLLPLNWQDRMHDKIIIVDGELALIGGRNIGDKYFTEENIRSVSIDRDILIFKEDDSGGFQEIPGYFEELWSYEKMHYLENKAGRALSRKASSGRELLLEIYRDYQDNYGERHPIDWYARSFPMNRAYYIHNSLEYPYKQPIVWKNMLELIEQAEESVLIQSPYVVPANKQIQEWQEAIPPGVETSLITNGIESSNNPFAYPGYLNHRDDLLDADNFNLYEYADDNSQLHSKLFIIDERITVIGTFNLDQRSANLSTESMMVIDSEDFAQHVLENIDSRYGENIYLVTHENKYESEASLFKHFYMNLMRPIAWLLQGLL